MYIGLRVGARSSKHHTCKQVSKYYIADVMHHTSGTWGTEENNDVNNNMADTSMANGKHPGIKTIPGRAVPKIPGRSRRTKGSQDRSGN